ncbi:hypothetical protein [Streptomyces omiyaensis]|uniref:hypothetical protein n=1 Tax=Streptomyces omiyaensis TaxID=68247 RepID=UPI0036FADEA3
MTPGRCARGPRAATFAALCVLLAATGHILMSGHGLPARTLVLASAATAAVAWLLADREHGLLAVTSASVIAQSALHTVFSWSRPAGTPMSPPMRDTYAAHAHVSPTAMGHDGTVPPVGTVSGGGGGHDMTDMSSSSGMLSAHLLAALLSGLWMAYGERAAFRLLRAASLRLFRPLCPLLASFVPAVCDRPGLRPARAGDERAPRRLFLAHSLISRGPPPAPAVL